MIPEDCEVEVINASPRIGNSAKEIFQPDTLHLKECLGAIGPDVILGCGKLAQKGLNALGVSYIASPHPSWRFLSKGMMLKIKSSIEDGLRYSCG